MAAVLNVEDTAVTDGENAGSLSGSKDDVSGGGIAYDVSLA